MEYQGIFFEIGQSGEKWFYEIPEIGLSPQSIKPFFGGDIKSFETAQKTAQAHIDIVLVERACNAQVVALVADMEEAKKPFLEIISGA